MTELTKVSKTQYSIPKTGGMHVPGKLFLSEELRSTVDEMSLQQVAKVACLPGIIGASIAMPDVHMGYGFPIGGVAAFDADTGIISPGGIGFDINCGVRMLTTDLTKDQVAPLIEPLFELFVKAIPTGTGRVSSIKLTHTELDEVLSKGSQWALEHGYATQEDIDNTEERGKLEADPSKVSHRAKDRGITQLGTLGAGNHFLEVQTVDTIFDEEKAKAFGLKKNQVVIMIHCGSRGLGHQVCSDYLRSMEDSHYGAELTDKNLMYAPLQSKLGQEYLAAMNAAANFAWCNRQIITHHVRKAVQRLFPGSTVNLLYDVSHNIAKKEYYLIDGVERHVCVHRKGATRAFPPDHPSVTLKYREHGQPVLIPGSMGTASYILAGAPGAMTESFGSSCHGAGRKMSRHAAIQLVKGETLRRELKDQGIFVMGSGKGIAEEAPLAYKDVDEVIQVVTDAGLAFAVAKCKPFGVLKG